VGLSIVIKTYKAPTTRDKIIPPNAPSTVFPGLTLGQSLFLPKALPAK
jgi:hypothetical protein